ncbi:MAG: Hsp20/alpha crystallin family protein [Nanoarchaeota archaeon]
MLPARRMNSGIGKTFDSIFERFFDDFDLTFPTDYLESEFFRSDVLKGDDNTLYVDVPGFNKDNLDVNYYNGSIEISGKNDMGREINKKIRVSKNLKEPTNAEITDGVLKLTFDTNEKESEKKKIELQ